MPINAFVDTVREFANGNFLRVQAVEIFARIEYPSQEKSGVDGGQLAIPRAQAGVHVEEMVKPTVTSDGAGHVRSLRLLRKHFQGSEYASATLFARDPSVINADADGCQSESDGGGAAIGIGSGTVADQSVRWIGFKPEIIERLPLQEFQELGVVLKLFRWRSQRHVAG